MIHALIVGPRGVGKSTLIRRVLAELHRPVFGFETKKEDSLATEAGGSPVYIYDAAQPRVQTAENLVGWCNNKNFSAMKETFDRFAPNLCRPVPENAVVLMDELGFMESSSEEFQQAVLKLLDGDVPVIAAVKDKDFPFLEAVRTHPRGRCFVISEANREALFAEVLTFMKDRLKGEE